MDEGEVPRYVQSIRMDLKDHFENMKWGSRPAKAMWQPIENVRSTAAPGQPVYAIYGVQRSLWLLTPGLVIAIELTLTAKATYWTIPVRDVRIEGACHGRKTVLQMFRGEERVPIRSISGEDQELAEIFVLQARNVQYPELGEAVAELGDESEWIEPGIGLLAVAVNGFQRLSAGSICDVGVACMPDGVRRVLLVADVYGPLEVIIAAEPVEAFYELEVRGAPVTRARASARCVAMEIPDPRTVDRAGPNGAFLSVRCGSASAVLWADVRVVEVERAFASRPGVLESRPIQAPTSPRDGPDQAGDLVTRLERLAALHSRGSLSPDEYERAKRSILERGY